MDNLFSYVKYISLNFFVSRISFNLFPIKTCCYTMSLISTLSTLSTNYVVLGFSNHHKKVSKKVYIGIIVISEFFVGSYSLLEIEPWN